MKTLLVALGLSSLLLWIGCGQERPDVRESSLNVETLQEYSTHIVALEENYPEEGFVTEKGRVLIADRVYRHALNGFTTELSQAEAEVLRGDPRVLAVAENYSLEVQAGLWTVGGTLQGDGQTVPTGVRRIAIPSLLPPIDGIDDPFPGALAVTDTGADPANPDLNFGEILTFLLADDGIDRHPISHGTLMQGIAAAKDNLVLVVGTNPGMAIHSLKVCDSSGQCPIDGIIAALDHIIEHGVVSVLSMSFAAFFPADQNCGRDNGDVFHMAICNLVETGVVPVGSASNVRTDVQNTIPGGWPEVFSVGGLADFDGRPGGQAFPTCWDDQDDSYFDSSAFRVDVLSPSVCIESLQTGGRTAVVVGTSAGTPHVAALFVRLVNELGRATDRAGVFQLFDEFKRRYTVPPNDPNGLAFNDNPSPFDPVLYALGPTIEPFRTGDANGDGVVNVTDAILVINHILGRTTLEGPAFQAADCVVTGLIDIQDVICIIQLILGRTNQTLQAILDQLPPQFWDPISEGLRGFEP